MNLIQARRILDQHKVGVFYSLPVINKALQLCGDLPEGIGVVGLSSEEEGLEGICLGSSETTGC